MTTAPTQQQARHWLDRWDQQQRVYIADREERFAVIADVVAASADRDDPVVVDLGAGPGSLSVRLLDAIPDASVLDVDADRLLLGLAAAAYADRDGLCFHETDLRGSGWVEELRGLLPSPADAVVSTTALHWLTEAELAAVYAGAAALLRPGGVLVNGDHLADDAGRVDTLARAVGAGRDGRVGVGDGEEWAPWWEAVGAAPELADLVTERGPRAIEHDVPDVPSLQTHQRLLLEAGFSETGVVWSHGQDRVVVGVR